MLGVSDSWPISYMGSNESQLSLSPYASIKLKQVINDVGVSTLAKCISTMSTRITLDASRHNNYVSVVQRNIYLLVNSPWTFMRGFVFTEATTESITVQIHHSLSAESISIIDAAVRQYTPLCMHDSQLNVVIKGFHHVLEALSFAKCL